MLTTKKNVLLVEVLKLALGIVLVSIVWTTSRINPTLVGKIAGIAGLLYGAYFFFRALYQKDHSNVLLRLRGDNRRIHYKRASGSEPSSGNWHDYLWLCVAVSRLVAKSRHYTHYPSMR